jgi:hypothetical protein
VSADHGILVLPRQRQEQALSAQFLRQMSKKFSDSASAQFTDPD